MSGDTLIAVIIIVVFILATGGLIFMTTMLLNDFFKYKAKQHLKNDILDSIINSQLKWEQLKLFWEDSKDLSSSDVTNVLKTILKESYAGKNQELKKYETLIQEYLKESQLEDPLAGLPEDIKTSLSNLFAQTTIQKKDLIPTILRIRSLTSIYKRNSNIRIVIYVISSLVGIASLVFAIYTYSHPKTFIKPSTQIESVNSDANNPLKGTVGKP